MQYISSTANDSQISHGLSVSFSCDDKAGKQAVKKEPKLHVIFACFFVAQKIILYSYCHTRQITSHISYTISLVGM